MQGDRDVVSDRAVGSVLVVVPTPILELFAGVGKAHEPVRVPASPCFSTNAFCASVNLDAFIRLSSSSSQGSLAVNSSFKRSSFQGADHTGASNRAEAGSSVVTTPLFQVHYGEAPETRRFACETLSVSDVQQVAQDEEQESDLADQKVGEETDEKPMPIQSGKSGAGQTKGGRKNEFRK